MKLYSMNAVRFSHSQLIAVEYKNFKDMLRES